MLKNMEYTIVTAPCFESLIDNVNRLMKEGWKPIGGVTKVSADLRYRLGQAMVRN